ncbi:tripartite motif-containing protein 75-like [Perognathus longimembris pacificus]|uniref:tripartite motif-containing protein 75-like n=1 Tax=Perognathus longimembris pacificus TaxID=214514 RepID=UPI00201A1C0B|nr:tripartite motif-containing protein 75-like [Perognathus longimembris pacificus]
MAVTAVLAKFQAESKCPVCLEDLKDPVTIECGHNFCRACIQQSWENLQEMFPCPVCRHQNEEGHHRSNHQLGRMIKIAQQLQVGSSKRKRPEEDSQCEKHSQAFTFFCEKDLELLCPLCMGGPGHNRHTVRPIAKAASTHREKLLSYIQPLKKQLEQARKLVQTQSKKHLELKEILENQRKQFTSECEHLMRYLEQEQKAALCRLEEEEKEIEQKLQENIEAFTLYGSRLRSLLHQGEEQMRLPEVEFLQEVKHFHRNFDPEFSPPVFSSQLKPHVYLFPPQYSALQKLIRKFKVDILLDPETAHPNLVVSQDKKCVTFSEKKQQVPNSPRRFKANTVVLGALEIGSGRHFWEVQVGDKAKWGIGVCKASLSPKAKWTSNPEGYWRMLLLDGGYQAPGAVPKPRLDVMARRIGIFLDYELGELSFYNMPEKSHICTFWETFTKPLKPCFYMGPKSEPLRITTEADCPQ